MPLTAEQKTKIKSILLNYKRDVRAIVKKHKETVVQAVEAADAQKLQSVRQALGQK